MRRSWILGRCAFVGHSETASGSVRRGAHTRTKVAIQDRDPILPFCQRFGNIVGGVYSPVLSTPTWVQPPSVSQSESRKSSSVVVPKVCVSAWRWPSAPTLRRHLTTVFLCTSIPAQRANTTSIRVAPPLAVRTKRNPAHSAPCRHPPTGGGSGAGPACIPDRHHLTCALARWR